MSSKSGDNGDWSNATKRSTIFSSSARNVEQTNNHYQSPKLSVIYQPNHYGNFNGFNNQKPADTLITPPHSNGVLWKVQNEDTSPSLPSISTPVSEIPETINESFTYQCEFCSENFSSDQFLIDHCARMHTKDVKCQHCDKKFYRDKDLHFHMRTHIKKGRGYRCQICTGLFVKNAELKEHMKIHDQEDPGLEGPYACNICDRVSIFYIFYKCQ